MKTDIILVGNGPSILEKKNGLLIDSYNTIVRFNNFETAGYEESTGVKTDILFTTVLSKYNSVEKINQFKQVIVYLWDSRNETEELIEDVTSSKNITAWLQRFYARLVGLHTGIRLPRWPSSGLAAICYFLSFENNITITGFDNFKNGYSDYYREQHVGDDHHAGSIQDYFINRMVLEGKITIL